MNESKILRTASDLKWYAHAYSEYLADVAQTTSNLMGALQEVLTLEEITDDIVGTKLKDFGIDPGARFILGEYGSMTALELAKLSWNETDQPEGYVSEAPATVEALFSTIRGSWTQCVVSSKAFESYASDAKDQVTQVSKFIQDVQSNFQIDDSVRDTVAYYQSMINSAPTVESFVNQFIKASGLDDADNSNDPLSYVNSDLYKFTGNTPGMSLDFSTVNKAITSTVSVAAKAVKGVFNLIGKGAKWLFNKAKKYVVDTVVDPAVCEYIDNGDDNDGYIDGFAWYGEFTPNASYSHFLTGAQIANVFSGFYDEYATKWIKLKLKVGEFLFRIVDSSNKWQCYFKPVAVDVDYFHNNYVGLYSEPSYHSDTHAESIAAYNTWLESVLEYVQPVSKDATKDDIYRGLAFSTTLASSISTFAFLEVYANTTGVILQTNPETELSYSGLNQFFTFTPTSGHEVTNAAILMAASGDPSSATNIQNSLGWSKSLGVSLSASSPKWSIQTLMTDVISIWAMCRNERKTNPTDYTFVPYSNNHTSFTPASWRLKSDESIAATRDNFIEVAITAVIVVVAVAFIGATVTKVTKNAFFKRQQALGQLENKMWNGGALTAAERRKYLRYNRKQNASKWLSSGSSDASSALSNDNQSIIQLIQG